MGTNVLMFCKFWICKLTIYKILYLKVLHQLIERHFIYKVKSKRFDYLVGGLMSSLPDGPASICSIPDIALNENKNINTQCHMWKSFKSTLNFFACVSAYTELTKDFKIIFFKITYGT